MPSSAPTGPDSTVIKYSALGNTQTTRGAAFASGDFRAYIPGFQYGFSNAVGSSIVAFYSTGKFTSGTKIRWDPSVSFTTSGRVYAGFTDNPEVIAVAAGLLAAFNASGTAIDYQNYANVVKGLGDMVSFPVWQETDIPFPTRLRRKRFDVNINATLTSVDVVDRSAQTVMFYCIDGVGSLLNCGSMWYHDVVDVEGVQPIIT